MNDKLDTFRFNHLLFFHFLLKVAVKSKEGTATLAKLRWDNWDSGGCCHDNIHLGEHLGELGFWPLPCEFATFHTELLKSVEQNHFPSSNLPTESNVNEKQLLCDTLNYIIDFFFFFTYVLYISQRICSRMHYSNFTLGPLTTAKLKQSTIWSCGCKCPFSIGRSVLASQQEIPQNFLLWIAEHHLHIATCKAAWCSPWCWTCTLPLHWLLAAQTKSSTVGTSRWDAAFPAPLPLQHTHTHRDQPQLSFNQH